MRLLKKLSVDPDSAKWSDSRIEDTLRSTSEEVDAEFIARFRTAKDGTTLVVALILGEQCFVAWAGDSRCITCLENDEGQHILGFVSDDHRPSRESEAARIVEVGGEVVELGDGCFRVAQGGYQERVLEIIRAEQQGLGCVGKSPVAMAVSRSLGDRDFKTATRGSDIISASPEISIVKLDRSLQFLALMSDGITDTMSNHEIICELGRHESGTAACKALVQEALARGTGDNVSVVFARLEWAIGGGEPALKRQRAGGVCGICGGRTDDRGECTECGVLSG